MVVDLDDWFPNFDLFVMRILPTLIFVTILVLLIQYWTKRPTLQKKPLSWMDILVWGSLLYLIVPIWRIIDYLTDKITWLELIEGLFVTDFKNYMLIMLIVGIMGAFMILNQKLKTMFPLDPIRKNPVRGGRR